MSHYIFASIDSMDWMDVRNKIVTMCGNFANRVRCIAMRLLFIIAKQDNNLGRTVMTEIFADMDKTYVVLKSYDNNFILRHVYPMLKQAIAEHNVTCEDCYYWEDSDGDFVFPKDGQAAKELKDLVKTETAAGRFQIKLIYEFWQKLKYMGNVVLDMAGTVSTQYTNNIPSRRVIDVMKLTEIF